LRIRQVTDKSGRHSLPTGGSTRWPAGLSVTTEHLGRSAHFIDVTREDVG